MKLKYRKKIHKNREEFKREVTLIYKLIFINQRVGNWWVSNRIPSRFFAGSSQDS